MNVTIGDVLTIVVPAMTAVVLSSVLRWRIRHRYRVTFPITNPVKPLEYDRQDRAYWVAPPGIQLCRSSYGTGLERRCSGSVRDSGH